MPDHFRLVFTGTALAVRAALKELIATLAAEGRDDYLRSTTEIVLGEILNNIVEHAYGPDRQGEVELCCESGQDALWFTIRDHGAPMPGLCLPPGRPAPVDGARQDLPEGGFGWFLVHRLADDLEYCRDAGCNRLRFAIPYRRNPEMNARGPVAE